MNSTLLPTVAHPRISEGHEHSYVTFRVDDHLCGLPVNLVREVLPPQTIVRTPLAPPAIAGVIHLRGEIVTVIDLHRRFDLPEHNDKCRAPQILVNHEHEIYSLLVDQTGEVTEISNSKPDSEWPAALHPQRSLFVERRTGSGKPLHLLNLAKVLTLD